MGKPLGVCGQCGKENTRLTKHFAKMCCPSCTAMRGFVKAKPTFVLEALQEFHEDKYLPAVVDGGRTGGFRDQYIDALEQAHDIEHAWCVQHRVAMDNDFLHQIAGHMADIVDLLFPGVEPTNDDDYVAAMDNATAKVREMCADQERLASKAITVASIRHALNIDLAVPDDQISGILHDMLQAGAGTDQHLAEDLAAELGLARGRTSAKELLEGASMLSIALANSEQKCHGLTADNDQLRHQANELTRQLTTTDLVNQVEAVPSSDTALLELALACLRGDTPVVADKLELMRRHKA